MEDWEQFRTLLRGRLRGRGALARLAKMSGLKSPVIGRWERGESRPSPANLERLAPSLGVPYEELLKMAGYLPGKPSINLDPRLGAFLAAIEAGWATMDETTRDVAERGARALFAMNACAAANASGTGGVNASGPAINTRRRSPPPLLQSQKRPLALARLPGVWGLILTFPGRWLHPLPTPAAAIA